MYKAGDFITKSYFGISNIPTCKQKTFAIGSVLNNWHQIIFQFAQIKALLLAFQ